MNVKCLFLVVVLQWIEVPSQINKSKNIYKKQFYDLGVGSHDRRCSPQFR